MKTQIVVVIALLCTLCGCASLPTTDQLVALPGPHTDTAASLSLTDGRARFREIFCATLARHAETTVQPTRDCSEWLWRLVDEASRHPTPIPTSTQLPQIFLVTGAFSECVGESARPFNGTVQRLNEVGYRIDTIVVSGRSGTEYNAAQIAERLTTPPHDTAAPVILIGYSKGANDILDFLVRYPEQAKRVSAVVSVAGAIRGSMLATRGAGVYDALLGWIPLGHCKHGDGQVMDSLREATRAEWLASNPLPASVQYFSVAAFTTAPRLSRALYPGWRILLSQDPRSDGQLIAGNSLIPGATLLGYINADHWSAAIDVEVAHPILGARHDKTPFPRDVLFESILLHLADR